MNATNENRAVKESIFHISAPPERIFPLLCPVRETEWLEDWSYRMVYSLSGVAEAGAVFQTDRAERGKETWVISRYDPKGFMIEFVVVNPDSHVLKLDIVLEQETESRTRVRWVSAITALGEPGRALIQTYRDGRQASGIDHLAAALEHFCQTGRMLTR
jgi:hypothetical protein